MRRDLTYLMGGQAFSFLFPLLATPFLTRALGAAGYGTVMVAVTYGLILGMLVDFGFNITGVAEVGRAKKAPEQIKVIVSEIMLVKVGFFFLAILVGACAALLPVFDGARGEILVALVGVSGNLLYPFWLLAGLGKTLLIAVSTVVPRMISLISLPFVVSTSNDSAAAVAILCLPLLGGGVIAWVGLARGGLVKFIRPSMHGARARLRFGLNGFISALSSGAGSHGSLLVLGVVSTAEEAALFAGPSRVMATGRSAIAPIQSVVLPRLARMWSSERQSFREAWPTHLALIAVPQFCGGILLAVFAGPICRLYLGQELIDAEPVLAIIGIQFAIVGFETAAYTALVAMCRVSDASKVYSAFAVVQVGFAVPGSLMGGAIGVALVSVVCNALLSLALVWFAVRGFHRD